MTDSELLLAISGIFDKKLIPVYERLDRIDEQIAEIKEEQRNFRIELAALNEKVAEIENRLDAVDDRLKRVELTLENEICPRLRTIESCYTSTYDRYKLGVSEHEAMKQDISIIKDVLKEHGAALQKIS